MSYAKTPYFPQNLSTPIDQPQLAQLTPAQRTAFYERALAQSKPIHISPAGHFSNLEDHIKPLLHLILTAPHPKDPPSLEAAAAFYSQNQFSLSIASVPAFSTACISSSSFRPSAFVTRLAVLYGPPNDPGGGNSELQHLLSMPRLRQIKLIFRDYAGKGLGPGAYLKPSAWVVAQLLERSAVALELWLWRGTGAGLGGEFGDGGVEEEEEEDITGYLEPLTGEERAIVELSREVVARYRGCSSFIPNILIESGWSSEISNRILELSSREYFPRWVEEQCSEIVASRDVEMS